MTTIITSSSPSPSTYTPPPHQISLYERFFSRALTVRLEVPTFESHIMILHSKYPISATRLSEILLSPTPNNCFSLDPRVPRYVQVCLGLGLVNATSVLRALGKSSTVGGIAAENGETVGHNGGGGEDGGTQTGQNSTHSGSKYRNASSGPKRWTNSYAAEEIIFYRLAKQITSGNAHLTLPDTIALIKVCVQWMHLTIAARDATAHEVLNISNTQTLEMSSQTMALGTLIVAVVEKPQVLRMLGKPKSGKNPRTQLAKVLAEFTPLLMQNSPQSAARLEAFRTQTLVQFEPVTVEAKSLAAVDKEMSELLGDGELMLDDVVGVGMDVVDLPSLRSRAGLYVYLNSLFVAQPLVNDNAILGYLHNRYEGDVAATAIDLILASFDILANATFRNERQQSLIILRSFLINKVPLLLTTLSSSMFPPLTSEFCITEALSQVDTNSFPTLSNLFDDSINNNMFSDSVRQDFCFACCLHGLIPESSIETLLGDVPMQSLPAGGRYSRDDLVQQCLSDPEKAEGLIDELEHMDGNVGAVSQAITEVIGRMCANRETMSLKSLCHQLSRKPSSLDIMLLFSSPTTILQPLCSLLDNWRYDEDQGEYQPVYEEFGSILLLVLSFIHRYNLTTPTLGLRSPNSFIARLLTHGHLSRAMETLSDSEQSHLDGWIRGLFDPDSGGLGDELMSACPPQDFYLLVPTLFHHIVLACSTNNLSDESLKYGLEYLVDIFLLPALIPGITWLASHLWESRGDANAVLVILSALIATPSSISSTTEAPHMLNAVLNIIARNLEHSLRWLQRAEPSRQDVEPLLRALKENLTWERRGTAESNELESWTSHAGGLAGAIKSTFGPLVNWAVNPGHAMGVNPPSYTHRQFWVARKMMGAKRVLDIVVDEIKAQTLAGRGSAALDIATAIVCAPDKETWDASSGMDILDADATGNTSSDMAVQRLQRRLTLREVLKIEFEAANKSRPATDSETDGDAARVEVLVRLSRRVEAQMAVQMDLGITMQDAGVGGVDVGAALGMGSIQGELDAAAAAAAAAGMSSMDGMDGLGGADLGLPDLDELGMSGIGGLGGMGGMSGMGDDLLDGLGF